MDNESLAAIQRLLSDFAWHADHGEWSALASLFMEEGTFTLNGRTMAGRARIASDLTERSAGSQRITRHVWSNLRIESFSADSAVTTVNQLTFEQSEPSAPAQVRVSDVSDTFRRDGQGAWRFEKRQITRVISVG